MYDPSVDDDLFNPAPRKKDPRTRSALEDYNDASVREEGSEPSLAGHTVGGYCRKCDRIHSDVPDSLRRRFKVELPDGSLGGEDAEIQAILDLVDEGLLNCLPAMFSTSMFDRLESQHKDLSIRTFTYGALSMLNEITNGYFYELFPLFLLESKIHEVSKSIEEMLALVDSDDDDVLGVTKRTCIFQMEVLNSYRSEIVSEYLNECETHNREPNKMLLEHNKFADHESVNQVLADLLS